jgi:hypothetical protein
MFLRLYGNYYGAVLRLLAEKQCVNHLINIYLILQFFIFFLILMMDSPSIEVHE